MNSYGQKCGGQVRVLNPFSVGLIVKTHFPFIAVVDCLPFIYLFVIC